MGAVRAGAGVAVALIGGSAAVAHHSRAAFDMMQEIVIEGTVAELDWKNPHVYMTVETTGPDGRPALQEIEVVSVSEARALGLTREAIAPGSRVTVRANPGRDGPLDRASGIVVTTAEGVVYPLNTDAKFSIPPSVPAALSLAGTWAPTVESFTRINEVGPTWPLTEAGVAAAMEVGRTMGGADVAILGLCEPFPPPILSIFPDPRTIEIDDSTVVMTFEGGVGLTMERTVHLNLAEHPADVEPSLMGHSIGRWDGDTLVVDTVAFAPHRLGSYFFPSSPGKRLVERFTLSEDGLHLDYTTTLEEPEIFSEPVSYTATWDYRPDLALSGEPCDPEIAAHPLEEEPRPPSSPAP